MRIIGVDIGGSKISAGLVSIETGIESAEIEKVLSERTKFGNLEEFIAQLDSMIKKLMADDVRGLGVGIAASHIDLENGMLYETPNLPDLNRTPLKWALNELYDKPVHVNNDANCFALGEKNFGVGKKYRNFVGVTLGTGFGSGIIIDNKLYSGKNCGAGEFGHVKIKDYTIEECCSGKYFQQTYFTSGEEMYRRAQKGEPQAITAFDEFGKNLGRSFALVSATLDPEAIILGGSVSKAHFFFAKAMKESLYEELHPRVYENLKIEISTLENAGILGAASLVYDA